MLKVLVHAARRDLLLAWRRPGDALAALFFFVMVAMLYPLAVGPEPALLRSVGPGVLWATALLASMLSLGRIFGHDLVDGTLEQMLLSAQPLVAVVIGKVLAHWLITGLPLVLLTPLIALQFDLPAESVQVLAASLFIGTPVLSLVGAIGGALTLGLRGGGALVAVLVLPLYVPVLVFGAGAVGAQASGGNFAAHLQLLGALLAAAFALAPWAAGAALRIALN